MSREFWIEAGNEDVYKVKSKNLKTGKISCYSVDLRNYFCNCAGFQYKHKCVHLNTVIELLRAGGVGIFWHRPCNAYYSNWDYKELNILEKVKSMWSGKK